MLTRVTLENFFSFGKATTIELNPGVNLLIGINASGKSNFLKALELLKVIVVDGDLEDLVWKQWGGLDKVLNTTGGNKDWFKVSYEFKSSKEWTVQYDVTITAGLESGVGTNIKQALEKMYVSHPLTTKGKPYEMTHALSEGGYINVIGKNLKGESLENRFPRNPTELFVTGHNLFYTDWSELDNSINEYINYGSNSFSYNDFDLSKNGVVRQASSFGFDKHLLPDGSNISTIINHIKNNHSLRFDELEKLLKKVNPQFKEVTFNVFGDMIYLGLREHNLAKTIPAKHISDGTLYYLLLLAICCNPDRGSAIAFDEPEAGLHPDMIHSIANAIKNAAADGTQLFIATHSPLLLNDFDLEDVIIFEKDEHNQTCVKSGEDFDKANPDHLVGQLWLNGEIGGKRW